MRDREEGTALVETVWLAILLLVPMLWIVLSVFEVQRGAFAVSSAARAAGRAYALAPSDAEGLRLARLAATLALEDQGLSEAPLTLRVTCRPRPTNCHSASSVITVTIGSRVDLPFLPRSLGGRPPSFALDARHVVPIGQFRERDAAAQ